MTANASRVEVRTTIVTAARSLVNTSMVNTSMVRGSPAAGMATARTRNTRGDGEWAESTRCISKFSSGVWEAVLPQRQRRTPRR